MSDVTIEQSGSHAFAVLVDGERVGPVFRYESEAKLLARDITATAGRTCTKCRARPALPLDNEWLKTHDLHGGGTPTRCSQCQQQDNRQSRAFGWGFIIAAVLMAIFFFGVVTR